MCPENRNYQLASNIRKRARKARRFAISGIILIIVVVSAMILYFSATSTSTFQQMGFGSAFIKLESPRSILKAADPKEPYSEALKTLQNQLDMLERRISSKSSFEADAAFSIGLTILRIASVFLAVYLVQILVGFTRYQFQIADHLEATADALEFAKEDSETLSKILSVLSPQHIQFGKMPRTPADQSVEIIKDLTSKIPKP